MNKLLRISVLLLLICILFAGCTDRNNKDMVDDACYLYTPQIVEDTYRYLNEVYIEKYPELGLRFEHGTGTDQRIMTAFAQQITAGCSTDAEKVAAIVGWIVDNIIYKEDTTAYSYDVLYEGYGNCLGKAMLMQDLCRVLGIPAVASDGVRGDMKSLSVEALHKVKEGHAWCFVYIDEEWILYDPTWGVNPYTNLEDVAEIFYIDMVGGITPIYDQNNMPPFRSPSTVIAYMNGKFISLTYGEPDPSNSGLMVNDLFFTVMGYTENDGFFYLDGPASFIYESEFEIGELYTNGWLTYGYSVCLTGDPIAYLYENGIQASEVVIPRNGQDIYFRQGIGYKLCMPQEAYRIRYGYLNIDIGYQGKVFELHEEALPDGDYEYEWSTSDPSIATIDENGIVTCYNKGIVDIQCVVRGIFRVGNEEAELNDQYYSLTVYINDDISRPAQYAALDTGGPAYVAQADVPRIGTYDIYPIMTDDMLTLFDPADGVLTLPTAQNANGYFIMPETFETVMQYPYDFVLPLAEGSILLDRNKLQEFTLVETETWGEMWYLPLTEEGNEDWEPGNGYEPGDIEFGHTMIPTDMLHQNGDWEPNIFDATPINNVITTHLVNTFPGKPSPNWTSVDPVQMQYILDQGYNWEMVIEGNSMILDTAAMQSMLSVSEDSYMMLWLVSMETEWCAYAQQTRLSRMATVGIYNICVEAGSTTINHLDGGAVTVTVPLNDMGGTYGAYFVDAYGNFTQLPSTVNNDGTITFVAPYFATYAIIDTSLTPVN